MDYKIPRYIGGPRDEDSKQFLKDLGFNVQEENDSLFYTATHSDGWRKASSGPNGYFRVIIKGCEVFSFIQHMQGEECTTAWIIRKD
jgi:hypothetical protein